MCIMIGAQDMMLRGTTWGQQAAELRDEVRQLREVQGGDGKAALLEDVEGAKTWSEDGVQVVVVEGAGHQLQNDLQRDVGAAALLRFVTQF